MMNKGIHKHIALFLLIVFTLLLSQSKGHAVPAPPFIHTLSQSDGTTFKARQWGDESCHGWETEDGYTIVFDKSINNWTYAIQNNDGKLISSSKIVGVDNAPDSCSQRLRPVGRARSNIIKRMMTRERLINSMERETTPEKSEILQMNILATGTTNIPTILINFNDTTPTYTKEDFASLLFGTGNYSLKDYFEEVSYGKYSVSSGPGGVAGWYTASKTHDYYGQNLNDEQGNDKWVGDLVYEAVKAADANINFSDYDMDEDGYVDIVNIIHQGTDEAASGDSSDIWAHRSSLNDSKEYFGGNYGEYTTNDKNSEGEYVKINDYIIIDENSPDGAIETVGVFAHEYGHALGLPDLYDTDASSAGVGYWSLMATGVYNYVTISGDRPAHLDAWCKYYLGWITPTQVKETLTDELIEQTATASDVYKLLGGKPLSGEYFLVENRQKTGFDEGLPGAGLLIWHVDGDVIKKKIKKNKVNDKECYPPSNCSKKHYGVALVQADGMWDMEKGSNYGDEGDPYPGSANNTSFTTSSSPSSKLYKKKNKKISITDISSTGTNITATLSVNGK